jgi:DNA end-binding protein Ku
LKQASRQTIDIVGFIPEHAVDPLYYDKAWLLAPDRHGERPYALLLAALRRSGRCALAKWAWKSRELVAEVRPTAHGLVLQQLFYAEEVRTPEDLDIPLAAVGDAEMALALKLIEQASHEAYDPTQFVDDDRQRLLDAVERKIAGQQIVAPAPAGAPAGAQVIDLMAALRASLRESPAPSRGGSARDATPPPAHALQPRKPPRRSVKAASPATPAGASERRAAPAKTAARKR